MNTNMTTFSMGSSIVEHKDFSQDDRFMHVKLSLCTSDQVANGMHFNKDLLVSKMGELDFMPIVGAIKVVEKGDGTVSYKLGSHEVELDIVDNELVTKRNTIVLGVGLPNTSQFETISRHGETQEYITFEAVLFQEKYPQLKSIIDLDTDASMELDSMNVEYDEDNGYYDVKDFRFLSHCLIGVPPAFKLAGVTNQFSLEDFKLEFAEILEDIKSSLNKFNQEDMEGGDNVAKKKQDEAILENEVTPVVDTPVLENEEDAPTVVEGADMDEANEEAPSTILEDDNKDEEDEKKDVSTDENFELSHQMIRDMIYDQLNPRQEDGCRDYNYWVMEIFETFAICQSETGDVGYFKFTINKTNTEVTVDENSKTEVFVAYLTKEQLAEVDNKEQKFNELTEAYSALNSEVENLRQFKQDVEDKKAQEEAEMELQAKNNEVAKFSAKLSNEEIVSIIDDVNNFSLTEITSKLSIALATKLLADNSGEKDASNTNFVNIDNTSKTCSRQERLIAELKNKQK